MLARPARAPARAPRCGLRLARRRRSKPSWRASDCSAAGDSARGLGGAREPRALAQRQQRARACRRRPCPRAPRARAPAARRRAASGSDSHERRAPRRGCARRRAPSSGSPSTHLQPPGHLGRGGRRRARACSRERDPERAAGRPRRRRARARSCAAGSAPRAAQRRRRRDRPAARTIRAPRSPATRSATASASRREVRAEHERRAAAARRRASPRRCRASVGPSQRVCSRPTFVSTVTRGVDHARSRRSARRARPRRPPPRRRCSAISQSAAAVSSSNWVTWSSSGERAVDALGRPRRARDRRGERVGVELALADPHALAVGDEVRRGVGARAQAVALEDRRDHPRGRGLAVGAEHVDRRRSGAAGEPSTVIIRRIRSRPKRIPNSSSERSCASARCSLQRSRPRDRLALAGRRLHLARGGLPALGVRVLAQVVDEHRAQRLAELALAAVQRVFDQPFGGLDVEVGLALVAAGRSRRPGSASSSDQKNFTSRWRSARWTARSCSSLRRRARRGRRRPCLAQPASLAARHARARYGGACPRAVRTARSGEQLAAHAFQVELAGQLAQLLALLDAEVARGARATRAELAQPRALLRRERAASGCRRRTPPCSSAAHGSAFDAALALALGRASFLRTARASEPADCVLGRLLAAARPRARLRARLR